MTNNVIIIGSGPAGLTAGIYASRAKLNPLIIEGNLPGGQLTTTSIVENWPGINSVMGSQLMLQIIEHAQMSSCTILNDTVEKVDFSSTPYSLTTKKEKTLTAHSIIIATGATHKHLECPGEADYFGKGVSVCTTCDAPLYKNKDIVIVGGGNSAIVAAHELNKFASKITIVHTLDQLTATDPLKDQITSNPKINII